MLGRVRCARRCVLRLTACLRRCMPLTACPPHGMPPSRCAAALLSLRTEATKLRAGIRLVQRQKELKSAYLIRFGESADLLEETSRADRSIEKLQKELGLKVQRGLPTLRPHLRQTSPPTSLLSLPCDLLLRVMFSSIPSPPTALPPNLHASCIK